MTRIMIPTLLCLLTACEGPAGADGTNGVDGVDGEKGDQGDQGDPGTDGQDGQNADCFGRDAVELTGLTGGDGVIYQTYPVDVTIEHSSPETLEYSVAGYGVDYVFNGDTFTAIVTELNASSQVIVATDGCTMDTIVWDPQVEPGVFVLDVVNLDPGGDIDVGVTGEAPVDTVPFETRSRLTLPWGDWAFDAAREGSVLATTTAETYEPGTNHVLILHPDDGSLAVQALEADLSDSTDPATQIRLTGVHAADGVPEVDAYDKFTSTLLFDDLPFGDNATLEDAPAGAVGLALDLDDDATTDVDLARLDTTPLVNDHVIAAAFLSEEGNPRVFAMGVGNDFDVVADLTVRYESSPALTLVSNGSTQTDTVTVSDCDNASNVRIEIDITHAYRSDVRVSVTDPAADELSLWDVGFDSSDDVRGIFSATDGIDLTGEGDEADFTIGGLADYDGTNANGTWTLNVWDDVSGDDGLWNSWAMTVECGL